MLIKWCEVHQSGRKAGSAPSRCEAADLIVLEGLWPTPCRMVPMRLIPDNAETVERIGTVTTDPRWSHIESPLLLEFALAVLAVLDGETP